MKWLQQFTWNFTKPQQISIQISFSCTALQISNIETERAKELKDYHTTNDKTAKLNQLGSITRIYSEVKTKLMLKRHLKTNSLIEIMGLGIITYEFSNVSK